MAMLRRKVVRITTVPISLKILLKGQLGFIQQYYNVVTVSSPGSELKELSINEKIRTIQLRNRRSISPILDFVSLAQLILITFRDRSSITTP